MRNCLKTSFENEDLELLCVAFVLVLLDRTKQNEENQRGLTLKVSLGPKRLNQTVSEHCTFNANSLIEMLQWCYT